MLRLETFVNIGPALFADLGLRAKPRVVLPAEPLYNHRQHSDVTSHHQPQATTTQWRSVNDLEHAFQCRQQSVTKAAATHKSTWRTVTRVRALHFFIKFNISSNPQLREDLW